MPNDLIATASPVLADQRLPTITKGLSGFSGIIASAFFGGFFAAIWSNHFESKRRIQDKRHDKYYEHRNTIVQIEQELIPLRVNIARNDTAISDAIENTNDLNVRFILRFYKRSLSTGLGLKLLSIDFINKYAELYSAIESLNSDIDYVSGMVSMIIEDKKEGKIDDSVIESYKVFLPQLKDECEQVETKSLELLGIAQLAIGKEDKKIKDKYVKDGKEIKYALTKQSLDKKYKSIKKEEDGSLHKNEKQPKFVSPFLDLKKVLITHATQ